MAINSTADLVKSLDNIREAPPRSFNVKDEEDQKRLGHLLELKGKRRPAIGTTDPSGFTRKPQDGGGDQSESSPRNPLPRTGHLRQPLGRLSPTAFRFLRMRTTGHAAVSVLLGMGDPGL